MYTNAMLYIPEIQSLLKEIHDVIEGFVMDEISCETAWDEYQRLNAEYNQLCHGRPVIPGQNARGLFYYHNAANFSKLTCILDNDGKIQEQNSAGDISLQGLIKRPPDITNGLTSMILHEEEDYTLSIHFQPIKSTDGSYIAAITSSPFFNKTIFSNLSILLQIIMNDKPRPENSLAVDYFSRVSHDLISYVDIEAHRGNIVFGELLVFNAIEKIFGHSGYDTLRSMSGEFIEKIKTTHDTRPIVFTMSFNSYVAIHSFPSDIAESEKLKIRASRYDFNFRDITLPYKRNLVQLDNSQSVHSLLEQLYLIEIQGRVPSGS